MPDYLTNEEIAHDAAIEIGRHVAQSKRAFTGIGKLYDLETIRQHILTALNNVKGTPIINDPAPVINDLVAERAKLIKIIRILWKIDYYAEHDHNKKCRWPSGFCPCYHGPEPQAPIEKCECGLREAMEAYTSLFSNPPTELNVYAIPSLKNIDDPDDAEKNEQPSSRKNSKEN
jgi:hypothetical protein